MKNSSLYFYETFVITNLRIKNNSRLNFMGVISVRLDKDTDSLLSELAKKRSVTKSDMVRILILRGLEMDPKSNEVFDEALETMLKINSLMIKNFKISARVLANTNLLMGITQDSDKKIAEAAGKTKLFLEKHGVVE